MSIELGIDSFVESTDPAVSAQQRMADLLGEVDAAEAAGLHVFQIGEHHREEYLASAPPVILAAAAARTKRLRLASAVTVLGSEDPVRVFQDFATVDLISNGRAEIIAGRGSFIESFPLFGYDLEDYDELFAEKLDLLLALRKSVHIAWQGKYRAPLSGQGVYPRPVQDPLPIWLGVGGTPTSFVRAGMLGLPLYIAIIGGEPHRFKPLVDLYRAAGAKAGHTDLKVGIHVHGYIADTFERAADELFPAHAAAFTKIGRERGWPPTTRAHFDAMLGPTGALFVGDKDTVGEKIERANQALGGLARISILMTPSSMPHAQVVRSIELLGQIKT